MIVRPEAHDRRRRCKEARRIVAAYRSPAGRLLAAHRQREDQSSIVGLLRGSAGQRIMIVFTDEGRNLSPITAAAPDGNVRLQAMVQCPELADTVEKFGRRANEAIKGYDFLASASPFTLS